MKGIAFIVLSSLPLYLLVRTLASHRGRLRAAERDAEDRDAWVGAFVEGSSVGQAVLDRELRFVHLNERLAQMHGVSVEDHLGRTIAEIIRGPAGDELFARHRRVLETGIGELDIPAEAHNAGDDGTHREWRKSVFPIRDRHGVVVGVGINVRDVTEEVEAERDRRARMETLEMVLRHLPVMVAFLDADGRPTLVNPEWERVIGWRGDELATREPLAELYPEAEERARVREMIDRSDGTWGRYQTRARSGRMIPTEWASVRLPDGRALGHRVGPLSGAPTRARAGADRGPVPPPRRDRPRASCIATRSTRTTRR